MSPSARRLALTVHVAVSVGWFGAVAAFLGLAVVGLTTAVSPTRQAAYIAMQITGWNVILPLGSATLLSGLIQSLGTSWGLFRHYWVVVKLALTLAATLLLLLHLRPVDTLAAIATLRVPGPTELRGIRIQLVGDAIAALLVLLVNTTLSVYKPRGITPHGWRQQRREAALLHQRHGR